MVSRGATAVAPVVSSSKSLNQGGRLGNTAFEKHTVKPHRSRYESSTVTDAARSMSPIVPDPSWLAGVVVRAYGKFFDVQLRDVDRALLSTIKGTVKRERRRSDLVAVGDRVWVTDVGEDEGQIEAVEPRQRVLARPARNTRDIEQVILANPDQVLFLFAVRQPEPHRRMLDRFLVLAEAAELPVLIGINKMDLDEPAPHAGGRGLAAGHLVRGALEVLYGGHRLLPVRRGRRRAGRQAAR